MSRPHRHPKTGVYRLRKHVAAAAGRQMEYFSLGTKSPEEAKRRLAAAVGEIDARWANLRIEARPLSKREAHALAAPLYAWWVGRHRDEPSAQMFWRTEVGDRLWPKRPAGWSLRAGATLAWEAVDDADGGRSEMEDWCIDQADALAKGRGLRLDDADRHKLARAVAAVMQRASLRLAAAARGEPLDDGVMGTGHPASLQNGAATSPAPEGRVSGSRVTLTGLLAAWLAEAKAAGRKPSPTRATATRWPPSSRISATTTPAGWLSPLDRLTACTKLRQTHSCTPI